jgi:hypothetical protein
VHEISAAGGISFSAPVKTSTIPQANTTTGEYWIRLSATPLSSAEGPTKSFVLFLAGGASGEKLARITRAILVPRCHYFHTHAPLLSGLSTIFFIFHCSRRLAVSPSRHLAISPSCNLAISPSCHLAISSSCHLLISPSCHLPITPAILPSYRLCHITILPFCHLATMLPYQHIAISSSHCLAILPHQDLTTILPYCHRVIVPYSVI